METTGFNLYSPTAASKADICFEMRSGVNAASDNPRPMRSGKS
jgi:hypothetical protein